MNIQVKECKAENSGSSIARLKLSINTLGPNQSSCKCVTKDKQEDDLLWFKCRWRKVEKIKNEVDCDDLRVGKW